MEAQSSDTWDMASRKMFIESLFNNIQWVTLCAAMLVAIPLIKENYGWVAAIIAISLWFILLVVCLAYGFEHVVLPVAQSIENKYAKSKGRSPQIYQVYSAQGFRKIACTRVWFAYVLLVMLYFNVVIFSVDIIVGISKHT